MSLVVESPGYPSAKSWNLLGSDADSGRNDADTDAKICASTHLYNCRKCSNSLFAISSRHVTVIIIYSSMDAAIILYIYGL